MKTIIPISANKDGEFPFLGEIAKELSVVGPNPAIDFLLAEAIEREAEEIIIVIPDNSKKLASYIEKRIAKLKEKGGFNFSFAYYKAGGELSVTSIIAKAKKYIGGENFNVILPDFIYYPFLEPMRKMEKIFKSSGKPVLAISNRQPEKKNGESGQEEIIVEKIAKNLYKIKETRKATEENPQGKFFFAGRCIINFSMLAPKSNFFESVNKIITSGENFYAYDVGGNWLEYGSQKQITRSALKVIPYAKKLNDVFNN